MLSPLISCLWPTHLKITFLNHPEAYVMAFTTLNMIDKSHLAFSVQDLIHYPN